MFINSLVVDLESSGRCCMVSTIQTSPVSYADDLATACIAKYNVAAVMQIAYNHSCRWRYKFNARKSAVLVYGDIASETKKFHLDRQYRIGSDKVYEKPKYDHVGVKSCINGGFSERTLKKDQKRTPSFLLVLGAGIKK